MTRVRRGYVARRHRRNIIQLASGFRGAHSRIVRASNQQVVRALASSKQDRYKRKREFRRLWIARVNAAARNAGVSYSESIWHLSNNQILPNRKILAQMAVLDTNSFTMILGGGEDRG
uniref:50S ribosomal protein L20 n=1 Tax=Selaginella lepidophylla TaxID=59777 RepID=A0A3Q9R2S4_SELLP|nr:ribosomal protein L20 [Selaginella lepidophylla]AZU95861.1 ribosomal protein L20 [Selaginella lepidophylla]